MKTKPATKKATPTQETVALGGTVTIPDGKIAVFLDRDASRLMIELCQIADVEPGDWLGIYVKNQTDEALTSRVHAPTRKFIANGMIEDFKEDFTFTPAEWKAACKAFVKVIAREKAGSITIEGVEIRAELVARIEKVLKTGDETTEQCLRRVINECIEDMGGDDALRKLADSQGWSLETARFAVVKRSVAKLSTLEVKP